MGLAIHNVLKHEYSNNETLRRKIPIEDVHYEYDLDTLFGNEMPKVIIRSSKASKEKIKDIDAEIDEELITQMKKVMAYVKNKPSKRRDDKNEEVKALNNDKIQPIPVKNNTNLISMGAEMDEEDEYSLFVLMFIILYFLVFSLNSNKKKSNL